jgi:3-hydroxybutyryl-CoA dehydrogenase
VKVGRVGILGAGTMGAGIAQLAALGGFETRLYDSFPEAAARGSARLRDGLDKGAARGRWSEADAEAAAARVQPTEALSELADCELLIEAAPEDLELKRELFGAVAAVCDPAAVLASNTSSLRVAEIAAGVSGPERVVGMHFFNPPALMKLVEVVATEHASEQALAATTGVAEAMGRTPIRAQDSPGFVANRLARPFSLESLRILGDGVAEVAAIDRVVRLGGGFRMGPFELLDLIGLDVNLTIARSFFAQGGEPERWRPSPIQEHLVAAGKLGRKSGEGYYGYGEGPGDTTRSAVPLSRIPSQRNHAAEKAVEGPTLDPERLGQIDPAGPEILPRLFAQIANEAAFALEEGIASPEDMETAMRLGFNWPLGPLGIAELIGPPRAVELLKTLEREKGPAYAQAPLLRQAAERGVALSEAER